MDDDVLMTIHDTAPQGQAGPAPDRVHASPNQLEWLRTQVHDWQTEGLVSPEVGERILGRYEVSRRLSLGRLLLTLGACFVGAGLIWLVAENIDDIPQSARFVLITVFWLLALFGAEEMASRGMTRGVVGAARLVAAFAIGGVIFQATQNLQVPAWDAAPLGCWGAATLVQAYAFRARGPLVVGTLGVIGWVAWRVADLQTTWSDWYVVFALVAAAALGLAAVHRGALAGWGPVWRVLGVTVALGVLFMAGLPTGELDLTGSGLLWFLVAAAAVALTAGLVLGTRLDRVELAGAALFLLAGLFLVAWDADGSGGVGTEDWAHGITAMLVYLGFAVAVAVIGTLRDSRTVPALATAGLVAFVTFQSFAVFGEIIDGAWVFLVVGVVFLATGYLFDRARRTIAAAIEGAPDPGTTDADTDATPDDDSTDGADR